MGAVVREVFLCLGQAIKRLIFPELPVANGKVGLGDDGLWVPFLLDVLLLLQSVGVHCFCLARVAELEVSRFDFLGLFDAGLFSDVFPDLFPLDCGLRLVVRILLTRSSYLAVGAGSKNVASVGLRRLLLVRTGDRG